MQEINYRGENLIFIISQPRSGSTLLQRILAGHPDILASAETWLMLHPLYIHKHADIKTPYNSEWASFGITEFMEHYTDDPDLLDNATRLWSKMIYENALNKANKTLFLDKTPRYYYIIPDLYRLFPKAKFIFLLRNPMAVLSSEFNTYIKENWTFMSALADDLIKAPGLILEGIKLLGDDAITINYERFVSDAASNISKLCEQLGITYYPSMLDYSKTEAPKGKLNDPVGIHQHTTPSSDNVDKWKLMANNPQYKAMAISCLNALGEQTIQQYGYDYEEIASTLNSVTGQKPGNLFPWSLAIKPSNDWSFKQRMVAKKYTYIKDYGPIKGRVYSYFNTIAKLTNKIGKNLKS